MIDFLSRVSFSPLYMKKVLDEIDAIWNQRIHEIEREKLNYQKEIEILEESKMLILKNIEKFIEFPEILKTKNEELVNINQKLTSLKTQKPKHETNKNKYEFIEFSKNILKHISNMLQKEKSEESV